MEDINGGGLCRLSNKGITVRELFEACEEQMKMGNANKQIVISDDDEGNGFHTLFFSFTSNPKDVNALADYFHDGNNPDDVVILG